MSVITLFSSTFCKTPAVVETLLARVDYRHITDDDVTALAATRSGISEKKISGAFGSKTSVFNQFTHEKERAIAWLRLAVAELIQEDHLLFDGFSGQLIDRDISHVLRVCLIADVKARLTRGHEELGLSKKDVMHQIRKADEDRASWIQTIHKTQDPWDSTLYDIVIPTDKMDLEAGVDLLEENLRGEVIRPTDTSRRAARDFLLAARVGVALSREGHNVDVSARDGAITLIIHQNVLMLSRLEDELKRIAETVEGVETVETRIGKGFHRADIYRKYDFDAPKLLLVDDEREFVHTLSERLLMRDLNSAVAYDGESALTMLSEDEPEVMILDLKMPGIDGIEVLREVKAKRPEVEVIILTGHGSDQDRETCMALGAFAYLQKPVDINILTETLKQANARMQANKSTAGASG